MGTAVPPKLAAKNASKNQVESLRYKNRGPKIPESLKYKLVLTELQLPWP
jgi:hypothetical protein